MSLLKLADGTQHQIEQPNPNGNALIDGRQRKAMQLQVLRDTEDELDAFSQALRNKGNLESMVIYYHSNDPELTIKQLEHPTTAEGEEVPGEAKTSLEGYTIRGKEERELIVTKQADNEGPAEHKWQLAITLGQRQYDEE